MNDDVIRRAEVFLKQMLDGGKYLSDHPAAKAYRLEHSYRVANLGREIARREGFDETALSIACLLHDVSYCEDFGEDGWREHGRRAARIARPFLETLGLPAAQIDDICFGIAIHVDDEADFPGERTPFALSVGDADNLDRLDAYRLHETLCAEGFLDLTLEEKTAWVQARLDRLRALEKLPTATAAAAALWQERVAFARAFYGRLLAQLGSSKAINP